MPLIAWAVVDFSRTQNKAESFVDMLQQCFQVLGESVHQLVSCLWLIGTVRHEYVDNVFFPVYSEATRLAEYLPPYKSGANGQGNISAVSNRF